eukprot:39961-Eustigmatos_ZCMA.PRE.1
MAQPVNGKYVVCRTLIVVCLRVDEETLRSTVRVSVERRCRVPGMELDLMIRGWQAVLSMDSGASTSLFEERHTLAISVSR